MRLTKQFDGGIRYCSRREALIKTNQVDAKSHEGASAQDSETCRAQPQ